MITRRKLLRTSIGIGGTLIAGGAGAWVWMDRTFNPHTPIDYALPAVPPESLAPTPDCADLDDTPAVTEGPFYLPNTPERTVLRDAKTAGRPMILRGRVLSMNCEPIAGAVLDFWNCDGNGVYDREGYRLRGHQFTNAAGEFEVETVKPSFYGAFGFYRTAHLHVKVQGHNTPLLTTQLYFPGEQLNAKDWFFDDRLLMRFERESEGRFDFVLKPSNASESG